jgi:hypothetical protein
MQHITYNEITASWPALLNLDDLICRLDFLGYQAVMQLCTENKFLIVPEP